MPNSIETNLLENNSTDDDSSFFMDTSFQDANTGNHQIECSNIEELIFFNESYGEILDTSLQVVEQQLSDNRLKQNQLQEEYRIFTRADVSKRKVPVHLYMPPYFKDENNMPPPMSAEAREKQELKWFDPLMKEEKKWTPSELRTLRKAVKEAMVAHQAQPLCSRRDILVSKLRNQDVTTTSTERRQWTMDLDDIMRKIDYLKAKSEEEVLTASADYSVISWTAVANVDFKGTRTEWAVKTKWCNEMNPKWNKDEWTAEEVETLKSLRESPKFVSWQLLALNLGTNRTSFQCMEKYKTDISQHSKEWTQEEDMKLITLTKLTAVNGHIQWDKVAQFMPGRTRQQVRTRYSHTLDSTVKHGRWTDQEDVLLVCAVSRYGAKDWAKVAQAVQNRNDSQCRERWSNVLNRSANVNERFTLAEDEQLLYGVKIFGKGNWSKCQVFLPRKTPKQLRRRYLQLIAAKLRLVGGVCNAVEAMKLGRRDPDEDELVAEDQLEAKKIPNELMKDVYEKLEKEQPQINESLEEFCTRLNEMEKPVAARLRCLRNKPNYEDLKQHIDVIIKKHKNSGDADKELLSTNVLKSFEIEEVDVHYMIEKSRALSRYYDTRVHRRNVDRKGSRVRPVKLKFDPDSQPDFKPEDSEEEKVMILIESLCSSIHVHDVDEWGKRFWRHHQSAAIKYSKRFFERMILQSSRATAEWWISSQKQESISPAAELPLMIPAKTTLAPTAASVDLANILQKARKQLNRLAAEHFYPVDVTLEDQPKFTNREREQLDEKRRMNIELADEVVQSDAFAQFYARMRTILLEPMRLQFVHESVDDEQKRLCRDYTAGLRNSEDEAVSNNTAKRPENAISETPSSISRILNDGIKIDVSPMLANIDQKTAKKIRNKRKISETVDDVIKASAKRPDTSTASDIINDNEQIL